MKTKFFLSSLALLLVSCATDGPLYKDSPVDTQQDMAQVVFYRVPGLAGAAWPHHYFVDNRLVAVLKSGGFTRVVITPGTHAIQSGPISNPNFLSRTITAESGRTYFFRDYVEPPADLRMVTQDKAEVELKNYHYQAPLMSTSE